ncbi:MAG TPA: biopolymer transporter ExbD [Porticoccaceae bacterium]|nr:biopolymer transporter ExbD [Porticoccaceae bacterium]HCO58608.1 biopolymer transporter ExbD [Porticoccaceae bacterium]
MALSRRKTEDESQIDLTPMLDVVFIMLIFFIVTATFINETAIDVQRPPTTDEPPPDEENKNIVFLVGPNGNITLEGRNIDVRSVRANVERLRAENPQAKVVIAANPEAKSSIYIKIADQAREAGIFDISLATEAK